LRRKASDSEVEVLRGILSYQFSKEVAEVLLPNTARVEVELSSKGRIRNVFVDGVRLLTLRPNDGLFSLSIEAARRIASSVPGLRFRVVVNGRRELTGSVLVSDVVDIDPELRPGDEVIVVDQDNRILAVGRLKVPAAMLEGLDRGEVVRVRKRVK
jgi:archaeosine-15-forming tRNA-guanine transglycosylase